MDIEALSDIGFENKEADIYLSLLKLGPSPASAVAANLGTERTTTYYCLTRMLEKGYVAQTVTGKTKTFAATDPQRLLQKLKEREHQFVQLLPALEKLSKQHKQPLAVEVRQGVEGLRFLYRDTLAVSKEVLCYGVDDGQYILYDKTGLEQYYRDAKEIGLRERLLTFKGAAVVGTSETSEYRWIDETFFQPTPFFVYADRLVLMCWQPSLHLIFIHSAELASAFRKHFELLWKQAKPMKG